MQDYKTLLRLSLPRAKIMVCLILVFIYVIKETSKFVVTFLLFSFFSSSFLPLPPFLSSFLVLRTIFCKRSLRYFWSWNIIIHKDGASFSSPKSDRCISTVIHFRRKVKAIICFSLDKHLKKKKKQHNPFQTIASSFL